MSDPAEVFVRAIAVSYAVPSSDIDEGSSLLFSTTVLTPPSRARLQIKEEKIE
jgi:hypothetical protein